MKNDIAKHLATVSSSYGIDPGTIKIDYPESSSHGDFSTNIALVNAKKLGVNPKALAEKIVAAFNEGRPRCIASVEVAGSGFINFKVKDEFLAHEALAASEKSSKNSSDKILIEYTDPNTFKVFHVGHLMANAVGESLSRLIESSGANVVRMCYPSDIGLHIAKSIWALQKHVQEMPHDDAPIHERTEFLGNMYVEGTRAYEADPAAKDDIEALNRILYEKSSKEINALYEKGRKWSLDHFEELYKRLGTKFDEYIFESEMAPVGLEIVKEFLTKNVFVTSEGAVVFKGEDYGLHTRVFINALGLPTYEAKELGLNTTKFKKHPDLTRSIIVTASEQNDYFKVLIKALSQIDRNIGAKTMHIGHGMMRFASGKMSSRTGNVVTAESLIADLKALVKEKIVERKFTDAEADEISDEIAIGAIKYTILRSSIGSDIIFDSAASISFEGDSGPYLQYAVVRARSVLEKSKVKSQKSNENAVQVPGQVTNLERLMIRYSDIVARAQKELAPQIVANYLIALAGEFNSFYASQTIIDENDPLSSYRIELTKSFVKIMTEGLWLLGIKVPKKM